VAIFYFALALGVGCGHYVNASSGTQNLMGQSVGVGLSWPWQVIKFIMDVQA
jgi:hypothetical protein